MRAVKALRNIFGRGYATASQTFRQTPLHDFHVKHKAKMVEFAGWSMPLSYADLGQTASHVHTRNASSLFDVSHMLQSTFRGPGATSFLQHLTPSALSTLPNYTSTLSVLLNEQGGIIDDLMVTKHDEEAYYVVTNAGRRDRDCQWIEERLREWRGDKVEWELLDGWGLLALQGPKSVTFLQSFTSFDLRQLTFGKAAFIPIEGFNLHVARGGYTGEDGFEISVPSAQTLAFAELLYNPTNAASQSSDSVQLAGLAARDSLRIEAGMCLYGNDLDEDTSIAEAGLSWLIGKSRKENLDCIGAHRVLLDAKAGVSRKRVGMVVEGAPARQGAKIYAPGGEKQIGSVTSGIPSPTLGKNIAMAYISTTATSSDSSEKQKQLYKKGSEVEVDIRGKRRKATIVGLPFVESNYYRG